MLKWIVIFFSFTCVAGASELTINRSYKGNIFRLYSVYSYKNEVDRPIGILGKNLKAVIEKDREALREFRKYQLARVAGPFFMIWGVIEIFVPNFIFKQGWETNFNPLIGMTIFVIGHGIGYRYGFHSLNKSIDVFNRNEAKKLKENKVSLYPIPQIRGKQFFLTLGVEF